MYLAVVRTNSRAETIKILTQNPRIDKSLCGEMKVIFFLKKK